MVSGSVEALDGTLLVEATCVRFMARSPFSASLIELYSAIFVQPRYAKLLNTQQLRQAMGEPPKSNDPVHLADGEKLNVKAV